ncbi:hypothetical protein NLU13_8802 [Sarocladium strictum]|uniref:Uncharacterized protein n=1 Tax=Sarocladium strictum TaxID=5046 RepID=A0AA39G9F1_SARSR|nr:hypothetical protein NLU13_8802 [Sarocladium strictum]
MARDQDQDKDSPSLSEGQSQDSRRPHLSHHRSDDSHHTSSDALSSHHHQHRAKHKQHHVGRTHARVPSSKALNRHHQPAQSARPPHRRNPSEPDFARVQRAAPATNSDYRRSTSEVKLSQRSSAASLTKSVSHSSLKRNRSHAEITKRTRSSDKLKRTASGIELPRHKTGKSQVHFDLGDDPEDEWVDASGSNSPYLSRKGSIVSSGQSSRQGGSASNSRPATPNDSAQHSAPLSSPERERVNHKAYLTSRLLQRTPSQGAPPQMTPDTVQIAPAQISPASTDHEVRATVGSGEALTSRFVDGPSSGLTPAASFLQPGTTSMNRSDSSVRRPRSEANLSRSTEEPTPSLQPDDSALVPRTARRTRAPPAETSRTQQKLNLQRASSVIEPSQAAAGLGVLPGINPLIGAGGTGYDGGQGRDPRMTKLMERTGMEYLVVRRYQNPIARSLNRLSKSNGAHPSRRIPRPSTGTISSKKPVDLPLRHTRNVSMPDARRPETPNSARRPGTGSGGSVRVSGAESSLDGEDGRRLSGSSLVDEEGDGTAALLRNLWDKSTDLSASTE